MWSLTSVNELQREGKEAHRWNLLHPGEPRRKSYVEQCLEETTGPVIAATDYIKAHTDQIREFVPGRFEVLGTDGFGRSDTRSRLRQFFEVSREFIVLAALKALADEGTIETSVVEDAVKSLGINPDKSNPALV